MLTRLSERVHAFMGGVNCAIVDLGEGIALLVDSGQDKEHGRRLRRAFEELQLEPRVILSTHSHADHYGGNAYLLRRYPEAEVWAPEVEAEIIRSPLLEPIYLFHGAKPLPELKSKWLMADPSPVHRVIGAGELELNNVPLTLLDVRGHAHRQLAVLVDGVLLATDALFGEEALAKHPFPFAQDVAGQLASAESLRALAPTVVLPGHGDPTPDLSSLIDANVAAIERASLAVKRAVGSGRTTDEVVATATTELGAPMSDLPRYHLNYTTVVAHLGRLREVGRVRTELEGGRLFWHEVEVSQA